MSKNDITGDSLRSRELSPEGKANWDLIFPPARAERRTKATGVRWTVVHVPWNLTPEPATMNFAKGNAWCEWHGDPNNSVSSEGGAMKAPYCPDCGCQLDENDHVFEVWFCPHCDEIVPDPEPINAKDLPEGP